MRTEGSGFVLASPRARTLAREMGLDLAAIPATGPGGRVSERDVLRAAEARRMAPASEVAKLPHRIERPAGYRRVTAERMAASARIPQFSVSMHFDASRLEEVRAARKAAAGQGVRVPTVTDFVVKAAALALRRVPRVNAQWGDGVILLLEDINIGVAIATPRGLVVPVVKRADARALAEISAEMAGLRERAVAFRLRPGDVDGGTFTISNLGMMGVERFTALVNPPQAAILAVSALQTVPVWAGGQVQPRLIADLTLTADHRVLDGGDAAAFLACVRDALEDAAALVR